MASIDRRGWHIYSRLVCEHQQHGCGSPQWVRVMVLWHESFAELMMKNWFWKALSWAFPALFGGKALMCANCQMVAFQSKWSEVWRRIISVVTGVNDGDPEAVLLVGDDMGNLSEQELEKLNVEDV